MTQKQIILIVTGLTIIIVTSFVLISNLAVSPQPSTETPTSITCEEQGLSTDPADTTKCLATLSTTTIATTTPPVSIPTPKPNNSGKFDTPIVLTTKQSISYADGLKVTLVTINDSRCPADAQCIWAGELAPEFSVTGGSFGKEVDTISLGTTRSTSTSVGAYTFTLLKATETNATISITKK